MLNVAAKNKLDYPPFGPTTPEKIAFQDNKLRCLFKAISEKNTSNVGDIDNKEESEDNLIYEYTDDSEVSKQYRQKLLNKNSGFYSLIMLNVDAKNKLDYPPFGPKTPEKIAFQNKKLKCLFKAISEKITSETGIPKVNALGAHGIGQQYASAIRGVGSQFANMYRGTKRAMSSPSSSVKKSAKGWFGYGGIGYGGKKRKGKKRGTQKSAKRGTRKSKK